MRWPLKAALAVGLGSTAVIVVLAWMLGDRNGVYLSGGAAFAAALFLGHVLWPTNRPFR